MFNKRFAWFRSVIIVFAIASALTISASAKDYTVDDIDENLLKYAFATAVQNSEDSVVINVTRPITDQDAANLPLMLGNIQNIWSYRAPEIYNYTRSTRIQVLSCGDSFSVKLLLENSYGLNIKSAHAQRIQTEQKAEEIYAKLVSDGRIPAGASQTEIARVCLDYICETVSYKNDGTDSCHTGYSAFFKNYAVCDGYTSAYNLLLKQAGITCYGVKGYANGCHEWTAASLDGKLVYIDATWCDNNDGELDLRYFAIAPGAMKTHQAYYQ